MSEQSLKRYEVGIGFHGPQYWHHPAGNVVMYKDAHALIDTLHAIESARDHDISCAYRRQVGGGPCNCGHGRMLAALEAAKGNK